MSGDLTEAELRWRLDLAGFMSGMQPAVAELAAAPLISGWKSFAYPLAPGARHPAVRISGFICGQAGYDVDAPFTTSPVVWIDASLRWARSESRLYRLAELFSEMSDDVEPDYGD